MIVFDLACEAGHVFEAWFGSSGDYEDQRGRGLLMCPLCGSEKVDKAVMAPRVGAKSNQREERPNRLPVPVNAPPLPDVPVPMAGGTPDPKTIKKMIRALAEAQSRMLESSDYVGDRFADEARAIHHGESEQRPIHGEATIDQARSLAEDGIEVAPLPFPVLPRDSVN